jgi:transcriptional regulator with GAF, ATPase, and Fis domain
MSTRKDQPLITVNCSALPQNLIESELFGREKSAFTGAHARQAGRFEVADGGTIFLDEIGEMPLELQSKLLWVLQDGEFERLGSAKTIKVNVRVIVATSPDLKQDIRKKRFRIKKLGIRRPV